ncbi:MAG TPA: hypothetical protein VLM75_00850 [Spirochaetota bacterium]|nr:hypothetical protein [Spirochaetota bacterium]
MKKGIVALIVSAAVCATTFMPPANAEAAGMSVGASTWYSEWEFESQDGSTINSEWSPMYGPVVGIDFAKDWSVTTVFLTGNYKFEPSGIPMSINYRRYDSDTTLNYSIFKWLKVFGGLKYMRYDARDSGVVPPFGSADFKHYTYGPGLGLGFTLPLYESLFALANISVMRLHGKTTDNNMADTYCIETGYNAAVSLAYYIDSMSTTLSLGWRHQYFESNDRNTEGGNSKLTFSGVTLAAVYNFSLGSEE